MNLRIQCLCIDTTDPATLTAFWHRALGWHQAFGSDDKIALERSADGEQGGAVPGLLFLRVPEAKADESRLPLTSGPRTRPPRFARHQGLGARHADVG